MKTNLSIIVLVSLAIVAGSAHATGKLYKWTDEHGVVHYGDKIPPQYAKDQRQILNDQGLTVKTLDAQKTQQQIQAEQAHKAAAQAQKEREAERASRDRMLLDTYTSVDDIKQARDSRLQALEGQMKITGTTINNLQNTLVGLEQQAKNLKAREQPLPETLQKQLDEARRELMENQRFLVGLQKKEDAVRSQFGNDIARFQQLTAGDKPSN